MPTYLIIKDKRIIFTWFYSTIYFQSLQRQHKPKLILKNKPFVLVEIKSAISE